MKRSNQEQNNSSVSLVCRVIHSITAWHARSRQRKHLSTLSDHMLKDIGITRADAQKESSKPFWRQ